MNDRTRGWIRLFLVPFLNLVLAFVVAGLVVLMIGENPLRALRNSSDGSPREQLRESDTRSIMRPASRLPALRLPSPFTGACSTLAAKDRPVLQESVLQSSV